MRIDNTSGYIKEIKINTWFLMIQIKIKLLKEYNHVFNGIIDKIKTVDDNWLEYSKGYTKIKFNSDDNLPLNKPLKFINMTVTIRCVFSKDNKLYPQVFLDGALFSL